MKLTKNGLDIRDRLHDRIALIYGSGFLTDLMLDQNRTNALNSTANKMDFIEQAYINSIADEGKKCQ